MERYSNITIRETNESKRVKISSSVKPIIEQRIVDKWQLLIDTAARLAQVPSGLIMRLNEKTIEVFLKSNTKGNPYEVGEEAKLDYGLYCENVIGTQKKLLVPDATKSNVWKKNNPDVDINMISYLGFPVNWPDGEVFGTVCLLDNKENKYNKDYENLLLQTKLHIENDLEIYLLNNDLKEKNIQLQQSDNIKSKFLSLISHDIRGSVGTISEFVQMIVTDFDQYDNSQLKRILNSLSQSASTAHETLEDLLSWSKNDILQLQPDIKYIDIIEAIEKQLLFFEQQIQLKGIKISKSYDSKRAFVSVDENMIAAILRNLISNAIKYNYKNGEIKINVANQRDKSTVVIEDTGIGMNQETLDKLFKYNAIGQHSESSAGVGLILTKEFLDKLNAKISVSSKPGKGSSFKVEIKSNNI